MIADVVLLMAGSSPHTRGAHVHRGEWIVLQRIIPAYAGSTRHSFCHRYPAWDHPRIRGEHRRVPPTPARDVGSSPHTRGAPRPSAPSFGRGRIIPAYAGSTSETNLSFPGRSDHPRIRGEHVLAPTARSGGRGSSPHTRGARPQMFVDTIRGRIIPAYAGSTEECLQGDRADEDHPRIRGEHKTSTATGPIAAPGSSPHTRGAPQSHQTGNAVGGIIPAYAGSTWW